MNKKHNNNFNIALNLYKKDYSHEDLINFLKNGSDMEKQISVLKLDTIKNKDEAEIFISNLTGCDGKIRECVSFRLVDFIQVKPEFFTNFTDTFINAIIDINGNICRNTINAIKFLKNDKNFCNEFCTKLQENTILITKRIQQLNLQEGKYKINKEVFKLYWYLETIFQFCECFDNLTDILRETARINDYTIREKTAKILSKIYNNKELLELKTKLKNDKNYYVRRI